MNQNPTSNTVWERQLGWFKDSWQYRTLDTIDGEPMEFEWNIFPGFTTLQLVHKVHKLMSKMGKPEQFQGRINIMSMFNDIKWWYKDNERECIANSTLVSLFAKRFPAGRWSFFGPGSETKWYSTNKRKTRRKMGSNRWTDDDQIRRKRTPSFPSNESVLSRNAQKWRRWKTIFSLLCRWWYDWNCFLQTFLSIGSASTEQSWICVKNPVSVKQQQGDLLKQNNLITFFTPTDSLMMAPTLSIEIPAQECPLQKHKERLEKLPQPDQSTKICIDAEFLKIVEVGQYFMTKHTDEFLQFAEPVTCRESSLPRDDKSADPKVWIQGNTKFGPVFEVTTS